MDVWPRPPDVIGLRREQEELSLFLHRQEQWLGGGPGGGRVGTSTGSRSVQEDEQQTQWNDG